MSKAKAQPAPVIAAPAPATQPESTDNFVVDSLFQKKAPRAKTEELEPTPEELTSLDDLAAKLPDLLFGGTEAPKKVEAKAEIKAETKAETKATVAEVITEPEPEPASKPLEAADLKEFGKTLGQEIATSLREAKAPDKATITPVTPDMSDEDRENYEVFRELEATNPGKYKGASDKFVKFVDKLASYRTNWEAANPGMDYDPAATVHEAFYSKHEPEYTETDYDRARVRVEAKQIIAEQSREMQTKIAALEAKTARPAVEEEAATLVQSSIKALIEAGFDDELKGALKAKGAAGVKDIDPLTHDVFEEVLGYANHFVKELHLVNSITGYFDANKPIHKHIQALAFAEEDRIKSEPAAKQIREGKQFTTWDEFGRMGAAEQKRHWILSEADLIQGAHTKFLADANNIIESKKAELKKYGVEYKRNSSPATKKASTVDPVETLEDKGSKPKSPAGGGGEALPPTGSKAPKVDEKDADRLVSLLF